MSSRKKKSVRRKGRVPPHLRPYLFKKGHRARRRKNPARKKRRAGAGLRTFEQRTTIVKRRKNPSRTRRGWVLIAKGPGGGALKYDGVKFSNHATRPRVYASVARARAAARSLRARYSSVLHRYALYAKPMLGK